MDGAEILRWKQILGETIYTVHRNRRYPLLETPSGKWVAKPLRNPSHLRWWYGVDRELRQRGFDPMPSFRTDGRDWLLTAWVNARPATYRNREEIRMAADLLARFHRAGRHLFTPPPSLRYVSLWERIDSRYRSFSLLMKKADRVGGELGLLLRAYGEHFLKFATGARQRLSRLPLKPLIGWERSLHCISHRDLASHNILIDGNQTAWLIDFETADYDAQVGDLWQLLSRSLAEQAWDPEIFIDVLNTYETYRVLSPLEREVLTALLGFPNEFFREALGIAWNKAGFDREKIIPYLQKIVDTLPRFLYFLRYWAGWTMKDPVI